MVASTIFKSAAQQKELEGELPVDRKERNKQFRCGCCNHIRMSIMRHLPPKGQIQEAVYARCFREFEELFAPIKEGRRDYISIYWWAAPYLEPAEEYNARVIALYLMHEISLEEERTTWNLFSRFMDWWVGRKMKDIP